MIINELDLMANNYIRINDEKKFIFDFENSLIKYSDNDLVIWEKSCDSMSSILDVSCWIIEDKNLIVFSNNQGEYLYRFNLENGQYDTFKLNRDNDDTDFYRNQFIENNTDCYYIYEGGVLKFDIDAKIIWKVDHDFYDWHYKNIHSNYIWFISDYDGEWGYRLSDGQRINKL